MTDWLIPIAVLIFLAGVGLGIAIRNWRWKENANAMMRIECDGGLYKVLTSDRYDELLSAEQSLKIKGENE